ncbi:MAG: discoidin domain-containing protein [Prevotellaceae bacterium]|jgi:hypothetical protein|nr:discoidin domain-containing protein [Prevotellaceae bacterium]
MKRILYICLALLVLAGCKETDFPVPTSLYVGDNTTFNVSANGETREIEVMTSANLTLTTADADWAVISYDAAKRILTINAERNDSPSDRNTTATLTAVDRALTLTIAQSGQPALNMQVAGATSNVTAWYSASYDLSKSYDGATSTYTYTANAPASGIYELTYQLAADKRVSLAGVNLVPQSSAGSGTFGLVTIEVSTADTPTNFRTLVTDYDCKQVGTPTFIAFEESIAGAQFVRISVPAASTKGGNNFRLAEIEFKGIASTGSSEKFFIPLATSASFAQEGGSASIGIVTNSASISAQVADDWCTATIDGSFVKLTAGANADHMRRTTVTITGSDGGSATVSVGQFGSADQKLTASNATASSQESTDNEGSNGGPVAFAIDGNTATYWHSAWATSAPAPHWANFHLDNAASLDFLRYYPRQPSGGNGNFGEIEVWIKTTSDADYVHAMDYNCGMKATMSEIVLPKSYTNVEQVKIVVNTGTGGFASCSELEFYGTKK